MVTMMLVMLTGILGQASTALKPLEAREQIAAAVQAAPEERRADATVLGYDETGKLVTLREGWVVYTPYATPESTGLSTMPVPGGPWLMFPGTPGAHIMINPPTEK